MALLDTKGVFRRCPQCDTAVADDANECAACGSSLETATREVGGKEGPGGIQPPKVKPLFGNAGAGFLSSGAAGVASSAIEGFVVAFGQAIGETIVRLAGLKTGEAALDDNPYRLEKADGAALFKRQLYRILFPFRTGIRESSLIALYRGLAKYADSGVGFHDALGRLEKTEKSPVMRRMIREIRRDLLEEGATLADAFGRHAYLLEPIHLALIEVGESLGTVGDNMRLLVEMIEERRALRRMLAQKMVFPCALVFIANYVLTLAVFMAGGIFLYLKTVLPPTFVILAAVFAWFVIIPVILTAAGRGITDRIKIELPAFGTIARANALARFARALGAAIGAGVEIEKSLRISAKASDNIVIARAIEASLPFVREHGLAEGLKAGGVLTDEIAAELAHGEATGTVADTLKQIAKDARERAARGTAILSGMLSFVLMLLSVLYAVYNVFTKMFMIGTTARHSFEVPGAGFELPWKKPGSR